MNLGELRTAVADVLAGISEVDAGDWTVHPVPVDAIDPPAFVLQWNPAPWRSIASVCTDTAQLEVLAVAARLTPEGENYPTLERMVDAANTELATARLRPFQTLPPAPLEIAGIAYLAARIQIRRPVTTGGN